jgi:ribosome biogenesis GTPase / thiamine phosphate phosphatase
VSSCASSNRGLVLSSSRRFVQIIDANNTIRNGSLASRKLEAVAGDIVLFKINDKVTENQSAEIFKIEERRNILKRSFQRKTKQLVANLDVLFMVTAPPPLFNTSCIDRMICAAINENIEIILIGNKSDLPNFSELEPLLDYYKQTGVKTFTTSALNKSGLNKITEYISSSPYSTFAFAGISGVGKSSLLRNLFPEFDIKTGDVSEKTGQGKQTTSSAQGYMLDCKGTDIPYSKEFSKVLIDLPGIQQYGISHLSVDQIKTGMKDIELISSGCKFHNCSHLMEPLCKVLEAIKSGQILFSRYQSYKDMTSEIKEHTSY